MFECADFIDLINKAESSANLGERTKNIVTAKVDTAPMDFKGLPQFSFKDKGFKHNFMIVAPASGNYTYRLFSAYNDFERYPVCISLRGNMEDSLETGGFIRSDNQDQFLQNLKKYLKTPKQLK